MSEQGKVAIITGAGTGIGNRTALALLEEGYSVTLAGRRVGPLEATAAEAGTEASRVLVVPTDVGDPGAVQALFARTKQRFGRLDLLFNNAGTTAPPVPLEDLTYEQWKSVVDVNLRAAFLTSNEVYSHMVNAGGGKVINVGSMYSLFGSDWGAPYAASKAGLIQLTKSLAVAWAKDNIQVNAVLPGWFVTDLTRGIPEADPDRYDNINRRIPTGRWGEPSELGGAAVFLASAASDYVTGATLTVDGGYSSA